MKLLAQESFIKCEIFLIYHVSLKLSDLYRKLLRDIKRKLAFVFKIQAGAFLIENRIPFLHFLYFDILGNSARTWWPSCGILWNVSTLDCLLIKSGVATQHACLETSSPRATTTSISSFFRGKEDTVIRERTLATTRHLGYSWKGQGEKE